MDENRRYQAWGAIAGGALMLVGSFLPWITITTIFGTLSRSGVDGNGDGLFSAGLGILAAAIGVALLRNESRAGSLALVVLGALGGLLVYVDATDIQGRLGDLGSDAALGSVGIGLWVVGAGAALAAVTGIEGVRPKRRQPDVEGSPAVPEPAPLDEKRSPKAALKPPDHGNPADAPDPTASPTAHRPNPVDAPDPRARLVEILELKASGAISADEYAQARKRILDEM